MIDWLWIILVALSIIVVPIIASEYAGWRLIRKIRKLAEDGNPKVRENIVNWGVEIFKGILQSEEAQDILKEQTDKFVSFLTKTIKKELRELGEELASEE